MTDDLYMQRALALAELGRGSVSPNPMVGCVIVHEGKIIGEGYHQKYGGPHAEVNAVASVRDKGLLPSAIVYVSLEPCSHYGQTPPCADLLVSHKVRRVVICNTDPNPLVAGKGIDKLKKAGIEVMMGVLEDQGLDLNRRFFTSHTKKRPYVILKWAETADGFVARENFDSKWISNQYSRQLVHKWRSEEDAIMVGTNTAKYDNASLTTRDWAGKNPLRIVIDKELRLDQKMHLFDGSTPTICFAEKETDGRNCEVVTLPKVANKSMLDHLHSRGIQSLLVEGGSHLLRSFIDQGLWDEARVFESNKTFTSGIDAPKMKRNPFSAESVLDDKLIYYRNN